MAPRAGLELGRCASICTRINAARSGAESVNIEKLRNRNGVNGSPSWARTSDPRINSPLLYQLSYRGTINPKYGPECMALERIKRRLEEEGCWLPELGSNQRPTD